MQLPGQRRAATAHMMHLLHRTPHHIRMGARTDCCGQACVAGGAKARGHEVEGAVGDAAAVVHLHLTPVVLVTI